MGPTRMLTSAALAAALALGLAACGSSSSSSVSGGSGIAVAQGIQTPRTEPQTGGKRGGTLTVLNHTDFEQLDPGLSYYNIDYEVVYATQRPLFSYKPNTFSRTEPGHGLRTGEDLRRRQDDHRAHPQRRALQPAGEPRSDLRRRRLRDRARRQRERRQSLLPKPTSARCEGFDKANGGPFPGITTPNKSTIVFHLTEPKAPIVLAALVLPLSAPVPEEYAKQYDAMKPTEYGNYQVATGPYMFKNDSAGKVLGIGYVPGKSATLVRNPNWNPATDFRPAYLNQIDIELGGDTTVIGRQVLEGSDMVQNETPAQPIVQARV